jgi:hypothetical protein
MKEWAVWFEIYRSAAYVLLVKYFNGIVQDSESTAALIVTFTLHQSD